MTSWNLSDYPECKAVAARMNKAQIGDIVTESQAFRNEMDNRGSILKDLQLSENPVVQEGVVQQKDGTGKATTGRTTLRQFLTDEDGALEKGLSVTKITNIDPKSDDYVLKGFEWIRAGEVKRAAALADEISQLNCVHSVLSFHYQDSLSDNKLLEATQDQIEKETAIMLRRLFLGLLVANELQKINHDTQKRIQDRMMAPLDADNFADYNDHTPDINLGEEEIVSQAKMDKIAKELQAEQDKNAQVRVSKHTAANQAESNATALDFTSIRFYVTLALAILISGMVLVIGMRRSLGVTSMFASTLTIAVVIALVLMLFQEQLILRPLAIMGALPV